MKRYLLSCFLQGLLALSLASLSAPIAAKDVFIILASTTSTEDSGLFRFLLPQFKAKTGIEVRVVAQGTGQALASARRGDVDVVLVHDTVAERKFVAEGHSLERRDVMYNDFILVGPKSDPAEIRQGNDVVAAFQKIARSASPFTSRGDKSGTHAAEGQIWREASLDPTKGRGAWYRETGSGMGPTLNTASAMNAYALTDRGTWLSFKNRADLVVLVEGDRRLINQYGVMLVNPAMHPHVKAAAGQAFVAWLTSAEGQAAIARFQVDGQSLFFPNYLGARKAG
jgi:tungstate transport system substrate-binding protein